MRAIGREISSLSTALTCATLLSSVQVPRLDPSVAVPSRLYTALNQPHTLYQDQRGVLVIISMSNPPLLPGEQGGRSGEMAPLPPV